MRLVNKTSKPLLKEGLTSKIDTSSHQGLEHTRHTLDDYGINYDQIIVRGNPKDELVKHANSGKYDIVVLSKS